MGTLPIQKLTKRNEMQRQRETDTYRQTNTSKDEKLYEGRETEHNN